MKVRHLAGILCVAAVSLCFSVAASDEPVVKETGKYRVWFTSPDLKAELIFHWADRHLGDEWMILKLSVAGSERGVVQLAREAVRLRTPEGHTVDLPTQTEFRRVYGSMRVALDRENAWGPPSSRFVGSLLPCDEWFFSPSGASFHRNIVAPSAFRYCSGPLVFQVPGGVQPGGWMLIIDLEESEMKLPFVLGEER